MKRAALILAALAAILTAAAAPVRTATENFVTNKIAEAVAAIPSPDYSTNNTELVETIQATAPTPDLSGYATTQSLRAEVSSASQAATNYTETVAEALYEASKEYTDSAIGEASSLRPQWVDYARLKGNAPDYPSEWRHDLSPWPAMYVGDDEDMTSFATLFHLWCVNTNLIDRIVSATNGLLRTETDPTVPSWAKAATKPTYSLNEICPNSENWLGVPGTTAAGKSIKVLAKTVNGVVEGGLTVTGSSNNDNNTTKYRYGGVTATRSGIATDYLFDTSSQSGVVLRSELAGLATSQGLAAAAQSATNYTDAAIREQSLGGIWDETLQVWWTPRMRNGSLTYEATTNVNLNAEN